MRYTEERNADIRTVPAGEVWVGIIAAKNPYIAVASRLDDGERVIVTRLGGEEARAMGEELIRLSFELSAPNN